MKDVEGGGGVAWFCGGMEGGSVVANRVWSENWLPTNCCLGGGGSHKNITEPYGGIGKFYRDITKILPPPPPPLFHVINIELSLIILVFTASVNLSFFNRIFYRNYFIIYHWSWRKNLSRGLKVIDQILMRITRQRCDRKGLVLPRINTIRLKILTTCLGKSIFEMNRRRYEKELVTKIYRFVIT